MKRLVMLSLLSLLGLGCATANVNPIVTNNLNNSIEAFGKTLETESTEQGMKDQFEKEIQTIIESDYYYPMANYQKHLTVKKFGQLVPKTANDRFFGYHTGDDIEVADVTIEVPIYALSNASVFQKLTVSGYGGVLILEFVDDKTVYHALYGHVDLNSIALNVGDKVSAGEQLGMLGDHESAETDGERKHLHFGIYEYNGTELYAGYVETRAELTIWEDPTYFLQTRYSDSPVETIEDTVTETIKKAINSAGN